MAFEVKWSPEAIEDVESIAEYISKDSRFYASSVVSEIISITRKLRNFPSMGRAVPEINDPAVREYLIYSYRLIYRVQGRQILIIAVAHGKQALNSFEDRF